IDPGDSSRLPHGPAPLSAGPVRPPAHLAAALPPGFRTQCIGHLAPDPQPQILDGRDVTRRQPGSGAPDADLTTAPRPTSVLAGKPLFPAARPVSVHHIFPE